MNEIESILLKFKQATESDKRSALATVVHVEGSSYRRPGARMLITEDGELTGSISGGCLEGDALRKALLAIHSSKTMLISYDTSDEDDAKFGMGLGCNGIIHVLIEPLDCDNGRLLISLLQKASESRQKSALITIFSLEDKRNDQPGSIFLLSENGDCVGSPSLLKNKDLVIEAEIVIKNEKSSFQKLTIDGKKWMIFTEILLPTVSLVIVGAGNDTIPLVKIADIVGWKTTVIDGRPLYADKNRFPTPTCQVLHSRAQNILQHIRVDNRTVFVLMSHNYNYDVAALKELIAQKPIYIGILGPKKRMQMMIDELNQDGITLSAEQQKIIHGPVGLNIGAETSEEIALSIVAEIKSVLTSTKPESLRDREEAIHDRTDTKIEDKALI